MTVKSDRENIEEGMNCCIEKIMFVLMCLNYYEFPKSCLLRRRVNAPMFVPEIWLRKLALHLAIVSQARCFIWEVTSDT